MTGPIEGKLYQFTNRSGNMNLQGHQYLLATEPSIMFATGTYPQAKWILPEIDKILDGKPLDYLFISHFEADECGGISLFKKKYPKITILSTNRIAGELPGFGYNGRVIVCETHRSRFTHGDLDLEFFAFPCEVHGQDGLICYERNSGVMYSSDVIIKSGRDLISENTWKEEISTIDASRVADANRREMLKEQLRTISPRFIATGHGSAIRITE